MTLFMFCVNISVNCRTFNPDCSEWEFCILCNNILFSRTADVRIRRFIENIRRFIENSDVFT